MGLLFVLAIWLRLGAPLVVTLFTYLAVRRLHLFQHRGKWLAVLFFLALLSITVYTLGHFITNTMHALPEIVDKAIPSFIQVANEYQIDLPFNDYITFKKEAVELVKSQTSYVASAAKFARGATTEIVLLVVGAVVAIAFFLNPRFDVGTRKTQPNPNSLFALCSTQVAKRFSTFYSCFERVLGAQIVISAINTILTALFVVVADLPYAFVIVGVTFLCGLLPVIGNLVSNTIIVGIGLTVSPQMALWALIFLVIIHKLEYFLNSKIIGHRIRNPVWLTLTALVIGERLMGIPGIILAPVILHYIKTESSAIAPASEEDDVSTPPTPPAAKVEQLAAE
jgi:predicted PurR-regulated permease PerM